MHTSAHVNFYACQAFLCYRKDELLQIMVIIAEKNEIDLSRNDVFLGDGLSGLSFCSRQKDRCDLLDLPVLNYLRRSSSLLTHLLTYVHTYVTT
jgi:hypothetical protein